MKQSILLIFSFLIFGCNSKAQNNTIEKKTKLNGKQIVEGLDKLNFFNLTSKSELAEEKLDIEKTYNELNFFEGKLRGETLDFFRQSLLFC